MPPGPEPKQKPALQLAVDGGQYPACAVEFIHEGLEYAVTHTYGSCSKTPVKHRHVSGQQLCEGLRELALERWGRLARTVLRQWNITCTLDFGRIVFSLIESGQLQKMEEDSLDDFRNVYDFESAFESSYRIPSHP